MATSPDAKGNREKICSSLLHTNQHFCRSKGRGGTDVGISDPNQITGWKFASSWVPGRTGPAWLSVFVATVGVALGLLQDTQHLLDDGPQRPAQLVCVVRLAQWRHVDEG